MADAPEVQECVVTFRGGCKGVGLKWRGPDDPHVCFIILTEDDGYWFVSQHDTQGSSSYWLPELIDQLEEAKTWLHRNAEKDGQYGYKFLTDVEKAAKKRADEKWERRYQEVQDAWEKWEEVEEAKGNRYRGIPSVDAKPRNRAIEGKCIVFDLADGGYGSDYISPVLENPTYATLFKRFSDAIGCTDDTHHCFMEGVCEAKDRREWPDGFKPPRGVKVYRFATGS